MNGLAQKTKTLQARVVSGSVVLLSGSGLTTAINLAYNIVVARFLGPKGFGQATVVYTILTLISAVTLSFQIVSAKLVAQRDTPEGKSAVYRAFHRGAWGCGIFIALMLLSFQGAIANYLNLPGAHLIALLAIGAAFYIPLGTRRGYIQGTYGFRRLATNLVVEGAFRLGGSVLLILLGVGVEGVIAANAAAVAAAYLVSGPRLTHRLPNPLRASYSFREISQAMVFFSGQVLINNCDIVLVKHFFLAKEAGLYAAIAMVGRVIFAFSSSVVNSMFPLVAGTRNEDRRDLKVITTSLLLVLGTGSLIALGLGIAPAWIWTSLFGSGFEIPGKYNLPYLLALYAVTTIVFSLSVVIITFEMSYKIANTSWMQLAFGGVVILAISRYHSSLLQVILVQLVLMVVLLICVAIPFLLTFLRSPRALAQVRNWQPARVIRGVTEDEVIAEFLRSDFASPVFKGYQETLHEIVSAPNLDNAGDNAKRRALLFIRHLALWKELPTGTKWFEVEINAADLGQIRAFPRAQWRRLARGNFSITEIAEGIRARQGMVGTPFLSKMESIGDRLLQEEHGFSAVILIGLNVREPLTVLDGNHRLVAAMLASEVSLNKLRFLCGLSPRMGECCWYNTNFRTLFRYGVNILARAVHNPEPELLRTLQNDGKPGRADGFFDKNDVRFQDKSERTSLHEPKEEQTLRQDLDTAIRARGVTVRELPEMLTDKKGRSFLSGLEGEMETGYPRIVLDCSKLRQMDIPAVYLLLCCLEEAMKRNGDVKLASMPSGTMAILELTGAARLFERFQTNAEAVNSFCRLPLEAVSKGPA
ncbi:MAG: STAS domain-containing protein [Terracidiphilus sp.]